MKNKKTTILVVSLIIVCLFTLIFGSASLKKIKDGYLVTINYSEMMKKLDSNGSMILYVGSATCHNCTTFTPKFTQILTENNITAYYVDVSKFSNAEYQELNKRFNIPGTPTVLFLKDGKEINSINRIVGDISIDAAKSKFTLNGYNVK